jgi:hypothetical protein
LEPATLGPAAAAQAATIDKSAVLRLNGDRLYPFDPSVSEVDLVIFWPGLGYGTQRMVLEHPKYGLGPALDAAGPADNVLVLIARGPRRPWAQIARTIALLESEHGVQVRSMVLGCWSGGASGASTALASGERFAGWFMADPSPSVSQRKSWRDGVRGAQIETVRVWRNPDNWGKAAGPGGYYRKDLPRFLEGLAQLEGVQVLSESDHKELLLQGLRAAIKRAQALAPRLSYDVQDPVKSRG